MADTAEVPAGEPASESAGAQAGDVAPGPGAGRAAGARPAAGFDEETSAELVNASWAESCDSRLREVLSRLVTHLHAFVRETELTHAEWEHALRFLTAVGQKCDDTRQEFILLSDVLGVSMLVDAVNNRGPRGATETTVLGPFHLVDSPPRPLGADIAQDHVGDACVVAGTVRSADGTPLPGARVDVWQANGEGFYDVQQPDVQPPLNLRALFTCDDGGRYWFRSVVPSHYAVPRDGPVADLLNATGRHPYRPAHIHFIGQAPGHRPVTTHLFIEGSPYLDSDAVFGVKRSLIAPVREVRDPRRAAAFGVEAPFRLIEFDLVLAPDNPGPDTRRTAGHG
ncbi:dioxygenase family protein [Streptomyces sp. 8L]|uniref:dioxygenase family protein n=1 Tax=Streptomyces sp. 8L TaxID=2877242 RepID=UPI001CD215B2|nr:dioxygenase [Streptomyces sp. 8L]MCA1217426.1 6-chlorohydroxyquinol-1,2-dioxygenase [Streptomyces sp. 8L]